MTVRLAEAAQAAGYRLTFAEETGSTNDDAAEAARRGDPGRHWFVAGRQTKGRGRHGRVWDSPTGNLFASVLLIDACEARIAPQLGFVAGLALHDAACAVTGLQAPRLALKWPNDLLVDGAKASGLLLEGHAVANGRALALVVGFGVNVASAPNGMAYDTACLTGFRPDATREALFTSLSAALSHRLDQWRAGAGFSSIRADWLARAAGLGQAVRVRLPGGERAGRFAGLDPHGRLQLEGAHGLETIDAGDLFLANLNELSGVRPNVSARI